jgi:hypothetical protein
VSQHLTPEELEELKEIAKLSKNIRILTEEDGSIYVNLGALNMEPRDLIRLHRQHNNLSY